MAIAKQVKPISYIKANAAEVIATITENRQPVYVTQNGEVTAVLQDIASYEAEQERLALLKILALGQREVDAGQVIDAEDVIADLRSQLEHRDG